MKVEGTSHRKYSDRRSKFEETPSVSFKNVTEQDFATPHDFPLGSIDGGMSQMNQSLDSVEYRVENKLSKYTQPQFDKN